MAARPMLEKLPERREIDANGCRVWTGRIDRYGYGRMSLTEDTAARVHRCAYEAFKGPLGADQQIDHLCRNRACFNPDHLEAVSGAINTLRGNSFSATNARKTHCKHGHALSGDNLRVFRGPNGRPARHCQACRRERKRRHITPAAEARA